MPLLPSLWSSARFQQFLPSCMSCCYSMVSITIWLERPQSNFTQRIWGNFEWLSFTDLHHFVVDPPHNITGWEIQSKTYVQISLQILGREYFVDLWKSRQSSWQQHHRLSLRKPLQFHIHCMCCDLLAQLLYRLFTTENQQNTRKGTENWRDSIEFKWKFDKKFI